MEIFFVIFAGMVFGSFASCMTYRFQKSNRSLLKRSYCILCQAPLRIVNLIPIFSYLIQGGKCHKCNAKISPRYIIIEVIFVLCFLSIFFLQNNQINIKLLFLLTISSILLMIAIIDFEKYFIPDSLQFILFVVYVLYFLVFNNSNVSSIFVNKIFSSIIFGSFAIALFYIFYIFRKVEAIGSDDIKFFFVAGFMLGLTNFLPFIFITGIIGIIFGSIWTKIKKDDTFPFAPALCIAAIVCLVFDKKFVFVDILASQLFLLSF